MSENFIATNSARLERIATDASSKDEFIGSAYERMKTELRDAMGITAPPSQNEVLYGRGDQPVVSLRVPAEPTPSTGSHIRVVYPSGNARFEIYSDSEEGLDLQEQKIRSLYQ
jgi:hypothetical protein